MVPPFKHRRPRRDDSKKDMTQNKEESGKCEEQRGQKEQSWRKEKGNRKG